MLLLNSLEDKRIYELLKKGAVGILPTDTVYGVVCVASNPEAVAKLYLLKQRHGEKPGTVIAASVKQLVELGVTYRYLKAVEQFWPNPISVIIPIHQPLEYLAQGLSSLPFRVVGDKRLAKLLEQTGPLLTTSANQPGEVPASDIVDAQQYFGDRVDFYVNGGNLSDRQASTIIRVVDDAIELIRVGAVKIDESGKIS